MGIARISGVSVVGEGRLECGPGAGLEAGLAGSRVPWVLFVPVDAPLVPSWLLQRWSAEVLQRGDGGLRLSLLQASGRRQPTFCMLHKGCLPGLRRALDQGERKLAVLFEWIQGDLGADCLWIAEAAGLAAEACEPVDQFADWFRNANTPEDLAALEAAVRQLPDRE